MRLLIEYGRAVNLLEFNRVLALEAMASWKCYNKPLAIEAVPVKARGGCDWDSRRRYLNVVLAQEIGAVTIVRGNEFHSDSRSLPLEFRQEAAEVPDADCGAYTNAQNASSTLSPRAC